MNQTSIPMRHDLASVRAVLFDLDGTLYRQQWVRAFMALELAWLPFSSPRRAGPQLRALREYRRAQERLRHGEVGNPADAQLEAAADASGLSMAETAAVIEEWMIARPLKYLARSRAAGLDPLLDSLERSRRQVGILSDYPAHEKLGALGLSGRFSLVLTSQDVGAFKPSPKGYLRACELWGLTPSDVLYVGDRPEVDAAGAAAAGMRCVIIGQSRPVATAPYRSVTSCDELRKLLEVP